MPDTSKMAPITITTAVPVNAGAATAIAPNITSAIPVHINKLAPGVDLSVIGNLSEVLVVGNRPWLRLFDSLERPSEAPI